MKCGLVKVGVLRIQIENAAERGTQKWHAHPKAGPEDNGIKFL